MWVARFYKAFPAIFKDHPDMRYIFLTLTVRNCEIGELKQTITSMNAGWKRLTEIKIWPGQGFVRSLEITRSKDGKAHPHFHCLIAVPPGYFAGKNYLSTARWALLWQNALRADYSPVCDVRVVKAKKHAFLTAETPLGATGDEIQRTRETLLTEGTEMNAVAAESSEALKAAIAETIKYSVKPEDMLVDADWLLEMADQLRNCRQIALGGIFKEYLKEEEPKNLVDEDEKARKENPGGVYFGWRERYNRYVRDKSRNTA